MTRVPPATDEDLVFYNARLVVGTGLRHFTVSGNLLPLEGLGVQGVQIVEVPASEAGTAVTAEHEHVVANQTDRMATSRGRNLDLSSLLFAPGCQFRRRLRPHPALVCWQVESRLGLQQTRTHDQSKPQRTSEHRNVVL